MAYVLNSSVISPFLAAGSVERLRASQRLIGYKFPARKSMRTETSIARTVCPRTTARRSRTIITSGLLVLLLALPTAAQAQFTYTTNNGTITIASYTGSGGAVTIPSSIHGLPVTGIAAYAISDLFKTAITMTIPGSVTTIGDYAFEFNYSLPSLFFWGNAPSVGSHVFFSDSLYGVTPTVYYLPGTTGWGVAIGEGAPTKELIGIAITANPTNGLEPLTVDFTSAGVDAAGNPISNWNWSFGDGSTSIAQNPSHGYTNSGAFSVDLVETNNSGAPIAGAVASVMVSPFTPFSVVFTANPTTGVVPLTVSFSSAVVDSAGKTITNWNWSFGDGATSTAQNPSHVYTNTGTFLLALRATNNLGETITGVGPASVLATQPAPLQLTYTITNGTITITGYTGSGGAVTIPSTLNGLPVTGIGAAAFQNLPGITSVSIPGSVASIGGYAFANDIGLTTVSIPAGVTNIGDYGFAYCTSLRSVYFEDNLPTFGLVVFSQDNAKAYNLAGTSQWGGIYVDGVLVAELTPITITANPTNGLEPLTVSFASAGVDGAGNPINNWNWSFGDGATSTAQNPTHTYTTYTNPATFSVTLVENNSGGGLVAGATAAVMVTPLTVAFSANPTNGLEALTVDFTSPGADIGGNALTNWNWSFGDGATSTAQNPSHTYTIPGAFSAALIATNNFGLAVTGSGPSITASPLTVVYAANPTSALVPLTVSFTSAGVDDGGNTLTSWNWSFGDGATSAAQNPSYTYTIPGSYLVALTATNNLGLAVIGSGPASVSALLPVPVYTNFTVLHTFTDLDGANPSAGPILSGNTLYGTTSSSLKPLNGTVFSLNDATLNFSDLNRFGNFNSPGVENYEGAYPLARLILVGGTLYGTAAAGAHFGYGDVFRFNTQTAEFIDLHPFTSPAYNSTTQTTNNGDGFHPSAALVWAGNTLFGTTPVGGVNGYGTVFSYNTLNSNFTTIYAFTGGNDGASPAGDLIVSGNTLYGTAQQGGSNGFGTVFSLSTSGSNFTNLHSFTGGADGADPSPGSLLLWSNTLYGAADYGGSNGYDRSGYGTVFSLSTNGSNFRSLYSFTGGADGAYPSASFTNSGETLYGVASGGGAAGNGTIFSLGLGTQGSGFNTLYAFSPTANANGTNSDGANPQPGLILSGNLLYGTARGGGTNGFGTVFVLPVPGSATAPIPLNVQLENGSLILSWNDTASAFSLQSAPMLAGVFTNIPNASSPYTNLIMGTQQFFRLRANPP